MRNINNNVVQGRLSENYLMPKNYRMKYFRHEIFMIYGILYFLSPSLPLSLSPSLPHSPGLSVFTAQVVLVFIVDLHDDQRVLCDAELWAANYGLLQQGEMTAGVSPAQVETLQGERVPIK